MRTACRSPLVIQRLEVGAVVGDEHAALGCRLLQPCSIGNGLVCAAKVMHRPRVDAARSQSGGHAWILVLVKEEAEAHAR